MKNMLLIGLMLLSCGALAQTGKARNARMDSTLRYTHDVPDGKHTFVNGSMSKSGIFKNHALYSGKVREYNSQHVLWRTTWYEKGKFLREKVNFGAMPQKTRVPQKNGKALYSCYGPLPSYEHKRLNNDGEFLDGKLWNGKKYVYDKDGLLLRIEIYKQGKYTADGQLE